MRPYGTHKEFEAKRRQAIELLGKKLSVKEVSQRLSCSPSAVYHWRELVKKYGKEALNAQPHPHRPCRMNEKQKIQLQKELMKGPEAFGYQNQLWTLERIAKVIEEKFGISYHHCHVWRIMQSLGWSCQKPQRKAKEQNEELVAEWKQKSWPKIKQQAKRGKKDGHFY